MMDANVCSSRGRVNSFLDVSFIMVVYEKNTFWATEEFFTAILQVTTGKKHGCKAKQCSWGPGVN